LDGDGGGAVDGDGDGGTATGVVGEAAAGPRRREAMADDRGHTGPRSIVRDRTGARRPIGPELAGHVETVEAET
jgi:hypothetical protein